MKQMKANLLLIGISLTLMMGCQKPDQEADQKPPNIIFLLTDDQRWDGLGFVGNKTLTTPNLDSLAAQGVYYNNAYVTTSICAVSRASILTGQYARRHGIWGFSRNFSREQLENTYPLLLRQAGYTTGFIGKYGVGNQLPIEDFDYWKGFPGQGTFNETDEDDNPIHLTRKIGYQAAEFIQRQAGNDKPFCLSISFKAPHVEGDPGYFNPDAAYKDLYAEQEVTIPATSSEAYFQHFPDTFTNNNVARNRWGDRFSTSEMQQESIKKYYRLIHGIDVTVGRILAELRASGQDKNTVIVFTSDNGFYLGEYGFAGKWYGSEPSIRVPMFIFDPRPSAPKPGIIEEQVLNIDIAPTLLSIAGVEIPEQMQGKDITQLSKQAKADWRDHFFYEHLWQSSKGYYIPSTEGVVFKDKKYMKYFLNEDTSAVIFEELYELTQDPDETRNLIGSAEHAAFQNELKKLYQQAKNRAK